MIMCVSKFTVHLLLMLLFVSKFTVHLQLMILCYQDERSLSVNDTVC